MKMISIISIALILVNHIRTDCNVSGKGNIGHGVQTQDELCLGSTALPKCKQKFQGPGRGLQTPIFENCASNQNCYQIKYYANNQNSEIKVCAINLQDSSNADPDLKSSIINVKIRSVAANNCENEFDYCNKFSSSKFNGVCVGGECRERCRSVEDMDSSCMNLEFSGLSSNNSGQFQKKRGSII